MTTEVWAYFIVEYYNCGVQVVPGHWPDFQSKEEVDQWIEMITVLNKEDIKQ